MMISPKLRLFSPPTAAQAAAWAIMELKRNRHLAELAAENTGFGNVPNKITKNHRKTYSVICDNTGTGITEIARPIGVIGAVVSFKDPAATPANNITNALECGEVRAGRKLPRRRSQVRCPRHAQKSITKGGLRQ